MSNLIVSVVLLIILSTTLPVLGCSGNVDDSDLIAIPPLPLKVGDPDNAYYSILKACEATNGGIDKYETPEEFMAANEEAFRLIEEAIDCPYCQAPAPTTVHAPVINVSQWIGISETWLDKADYLLEQGKEQEAFDWALNIAQVGSKMESCYGPLIYFLVAVATKEPGIEWLRERLPNAILPPETLKRYADEVGSLLADKEALAFCFKLEYTIIANAIDEVWDETDESRNAFFFLIYNPNETKEWVVKAFRPMVKAALGEPYEIDYDVPSMDAVPELGIGCWSYNCRINSSKNSSR